VKLTVAGQRTTVLIWGLVAVCMLVPVGIAAANPLQASRDAFWIVGGMAGVVALALMFVQPLLAAGYLPGASVPAGRRWHRLVGTMVVVTVVLHVGGLYLSSPDDVADVMLLVAPTPFSVYGVMGLCGVVLTAILVAVRSRSGLRYASWRILHNALALVVVISSIAHALLIEGAMGNLSKVILCALVLAATVTVLFRIHVTKALTKDHNESTML
jgi:predicted ferric reductase